MKRIAGRRAAYDVRTIEYIAQESACSTYRDVQPMGDALGVELRPKGFAQRRPRNGAAGECDQIREDLAPSFWRRQRCIVAGAVNAKGPKHIRAQKRPALRGWYRAD